MNTTSPVLELRNVIKQFAGVDASSSAGPVPVLKDVNLEVRKGESLAIVGPSGSGKSTLLNILGTLEQPTSGSVRLEGRELAGLDPNEIARVRNQRLGFVFQSHHLLAHCTVLENVLLPTLAFPRTGGQSAALDRARRLLDRVGLWQRMSHRPSQISGGERQRAAVVRALINEPGILLADEPTGALDRAAASSLGDLLVELHARENLSMMVVTHALDLAARMGRLLELRDGQLHPPRGTP